MTALTACGGTDPGSGTGTLFASLEADGRPDSTRVRVVVKKRGNPVIGANVVVTDGESGVAKNLEGLGSDTTADYRYEGTFNSYVRTLELKITSGNGGEGRFRNAAGNALPPCNGIVISMGVSDPGGFCGVWHSRHAPSSTAR